MPIDVTLYIREAFRENYTTLDLPRKNLSKIPSEIGELKHLRSLNLSGNYLTQLPSEIGELINLKSLNLSGNYLTQLPSEIIKLKNLSELYLAENNFEKLPKEIFGLRSLKTLYLSGNHIKKLTPKIRDLKNLSTLDLSKNLLEELPPEIGELKKLRSLDLDGNSLSELPPEIKGMCNLETLKLSGNPLTSPPPEIVSRGLKAIFTFLKQSKNTENNEAKLILVGNGEVGKTCLAYRLIYNKFLGPSKITEGIKISKWAFPVKKTKDSEIKLNIWDFGGQEIYHATHQFFLTTRSLYLLLWNARKTKDYDNIYYWLHTIEAFGGDSQIILVMSKMNESDDDLNLKDLRNRFPQIVGYTKIDSSDGKGIDVLKDKIHDIAWDMPLMRVKWIDSWYNVRQKLENLEENWISYDRFYKICKSEYLNNQNINVLDDYLNDLGVILHFKDRETLKNIIILKPEWATRAFYKILSTKSILHREGVLLHSELGQIWDKEIYSPDIYNQLMELINKFELSYELPSKNKYLIPELLPVNAPDFEWNEEDNIYFYYCYDYFLPQGIITRFIVRMHQDLEIKENGLPLCWREGAVLKFQNTRALVKMKLAEKQIEIKVRGENKREILEVIRYHLDHLNASIKKLNVSKKVPCNCLDNCSEKYSYDNLLKAEKSDVEYIQCHVSYKNISISSLLDGYKMREERLKECEYDVFISYSSKDKSLIANLIRDFKQEEITYWIDTEQIKFGDIITQKIEEGLNNSRCILACLSKNQKNSGWTKAEYSSILNAEFSGKSKKTVIPLKLDNCEDDDIPPLLRDIRRVTYSNKDELYEFIKFLKG